MSFLFVCLYFVRKGMALEAKQQPKYRQVPGYDVFEDWMPGGLQGGWGGVVS